MSAITNKTQCSPSIIQEEIQVCACNRNTFFIDGTFPTIHIKMGSTFNKHWFYMHPRYYVQWDSSLAGCQIFIAKETYIYANQWLLGDPFLRNYYSVYSLDKMRMGLVGSAFTTTSSFLS